MIEKQEKVIQEALKQLEQLKSMSGVDKKEGAALMPDINNMAGSIREEVEKRRKEIMEHIERIKADAQRQAKEAMNNATNIGAPMHGLPMQGMSGMPMAMPQLPSYLGGPGKNMERDEASRKMNELIENAPKKHRKKLEEIKKHLDAEPQKTQVLDSKEMFEKMTSNLSDEMVKKIKERFEKKEE